MVLERTANLPDVSFQHIDADGYTRPQGCEQFIFANRLIRAFYQVLEHSDRLGAQAQPLLPVPELTSYDLKMKGREDEARRRGFHRQLQQDKH
jgi:hypothetical protein